MAHFSQSMADFYGHDDALEPALAAVCEALRNYNDVGVTLGKRGTFLGLVQSFEKYRSIEDNDVELRRKYRKNEPYNPEMKPRRIFCKNFQKFGSCRSKRCFHKHECAYCGSRNHGEKSCKIKTGHHYRNRRKRSYSR